MKHPIVISLSVALLAACSSSEDMVTPTQTDSSGVSLIVYPNTLELSSDNRWSTEPNPIVAVGEPTPELFRVTTALFNSAGGFVVADGSSQEILIFDEMGELVHRVGGEGGGPGEFTQLLSLTVGVGDSLFAYDHRERRFSVFDQGGDFIRSAPLRGLDGLGWPVDVSVLHGSQIAGAFRRSGEGPGQTRDSMAIVVFDADGEVAETLGFFPHSYTDWGPHNDPHHGGSAVFPAPVPLSSVAAAGFGSRAVFVGLPDSYSLIRVESNGTRRETRWAKQAHAATEAHRKQVIETLAARLGNSPELDVLRNLDLPTSLPAFGCEPLTQLVGEKGLVVTDDGGVWLQPFRLPNDSGTSSWPMFDADGLYEGLAVLPARFRLTAVQGDRALGVFKDSMNVESVRVYRMRAGS